MLNINVFNAIGNLALTAKRRQTEEYRQFLAFYQSVVETAPTEVVDLFGSLGVKVKSSGKTEDWGLELTATDFLWWKRKIEDEGVRFVKPLAAIESDILLQMSRQADAKKLEPQERKQLIGLLTGTAGSGGA